MVSGGYPERKDVKERGGVPVDKKFEHTSTRNTHLEPQMKTPNTTSSDAFVWISQWFSLETECNNYLS